MIVTVKKVFKKQKKDGSGEYDAATLVDENGQEKTFGIFQDKQFYVEGNVLEVVIEKNDKGFQNIVSVESAKDKQAEKVNVTKPVPTKSLIEEAEKHGTVEFKVEGEELRKIRSMSAAYSKDWLCSPAGEGHGLADMGKLAVQIANYIISGEEIKGL
ncbi:hypothetical protein LCGC14_0514330 [marine sediment metagenome]|uniref:Uncharacterized protein n=1 Tax=marine sediment metagenome TaxID=412755 RepID=A0A0F9S502_9ZZZZ